MKYIIRGNNIEVTQAIRGYIEDKLSRMDKYFTKPKEVEAKVIISVNGINQKVEVTINGGNKYFIRAEEISEDLYASIDVAIDKLERQFRKYKTRLNKIDREGFVVSEEKLEEIEEPLVKRRKELFLKPMDEEEAITQMELLEHTFFIFKNIDNNKICVIYKRKDEDYGILETN